MGTPYEDAISRVTDALKEEGFGVLTEIDVKATLNPPFAHRSLEADLDVGLLLPCNVIVYETDDKKAYIAAINPVSALEIIQSQELRNIAEEVSEKLKRVVEMIGRDVKA